MNSNQSINPFQNDANQTIFNQQLSNSNTNSKSSDLDKAGSDDNNMFQFNERETKKRQTGRFKH
jgi:hypothetical protein